MSLSQPPFEARLECQEKFTLSFAIVLKIGYHWEHNCATVSPDNRANAMLPLHWHVNPASDDFITLRLAVQSTAEVREHLRGPPPKGPELKMSQEHLEGLSHGEPPLETTELQEQDEQKVDRYRLRELYRTGFLNPAHTPKVCGLSWIQLSKHVHYPLECIYRHDK
jgi:hypothetical protein